MARKKFRIKKKPAVPKRSSYKGRRGTVNVDCDGTLSSFIQDLQEYEAKYSEATIELELDYGYCYYEGDTPSAKIEITFVKDDETLYQKAVEKYKVKLAAYNEWYAENKDAVKEEMDLRATEETEKSLREATRLEAQAAKLRKHAR